VPRVKLLVYSDYLCPWCYNAALRMRRLQEQFGASLEIAWRSYLLRPRPDPGRSLEAFRAYTRSWRRPAADPDAPEFRVWEGEAGPPSHSVPPHVAAKAAASLGPEAFDRIHERLLRAYFAENRDVTEASTLREIWREAGLPDADFARTEDPAFLRSTLAEHEEALELGITGVPTVRLDGQPAFIIGAHPYELYERWIQRALGDSTRAGAAPA
jgi:predicted DsbA family dithiol-disulfide isomerase